MAEKGDFPSSTLNERYLELMRTGNKLYDKIFSSEGSPYLSAYDVVMCLSPFGYSKAWRNWFCRRGGNGFILCRPIGSIFATNDRSVGVVFGAKQSKVFDSNPHGSRGGLIATSTCPLKKAVSICLQQGWC